MPGDTPVAMPVEPIVAAAVLLLVQVPPETPSVSMVVAATHTVDAPLMAVGDKLIVTGLVATQLPPVEKVIIALPDDTPVTMPEEPTDAISVLLLLHVPPEEVSLNVAVEPEQMPETPLMAPGAG